MAAKFILPFFNIAIIHSLLKRLLNTYYVPGTILALGILPRKGQTWPLLSRHLYCHVWLSPSACDHCLRALEKAEENAQRLTGKPGQVLPHPELCTVRKDLHQNCPHCQVSIPGDCVHLEGGWWGRTELRETRVRTDLVMALENHDVGQDIEKAELLFQSHCLEKRLDGSLPWRPGRGSFLSS